MFFCVNARCNGKNYNEGSNWYGAILTNSYDVMPPDETPDGERSIIAGFPVTDDNFIWVEDSALTGKTEEDINAYKNHIAEIDARLDAGINPIIVFTHGQFWLFEDFVHRENYLGTKYFWLKLDENVFPNGVEDVFTLFEL